MHYTAHATPLRNQFKTRVFNYYRKGLLYIMHNFIIIGATTWHCFLIINLNNNTMCNLMDDKLNCPIQALQYAAPVKCSQSITCCLCFIHKRNFIGCYILICSHLFNINQRYIWQTWLWFDSRLQEVLFHFNLSIKSSFNNSYDSLFPTNAFSCVKLLNTYNFSRMSKCNKFVSVHPSIKTNVYILIF